MPVKHMPAKSSSKIKILDSSKLNEFADDNFKYDEDDRRFSRWVQNTVGKGEITRYSYPNSVFKKLALQTCRSKGLLGKGLKLMVTGCITLDFR